MHDRPINQDTVLRQEIATLFRNPADREDGRLASQRIILPKSEFRLLLYEKGHLIFLGGALILEDLLGLHRTVLQP